jgi:uncharacterized protein
MSGHGARATDSGERERFECTRCGACCIAPDISTTNKPAGQRCEHLTEDLLCGIYDHRPDVCRRYQPDEICLMIAAPTLAERVRKYAELFDIRPEDSH